MYLPNVSRPRAAKLILAALAVSVSAFPISGMAQTTPGTSVEPPAAAAGPASVSGLAERLLDAVVNISTTQNVQQRGQGRVPMPRLPEGSPFEEYFGEFFGEGELQPRVPSPGSSLGSGFIIDASEGIVVTNNHVITDADEIVVNFADGSKRTAELVGVDTKTDLAVLKIDPTGKDLVEVPFGDSDQMKIGDWVMAIGNPFGFGGSVSIGIVSAQNRQIGSGPYDDYIQTDAAINRGNSGGPLFNMHGEVIGINTAIISPTGGSIGIGFAIPSKLALTVVSQLREFGETRRGWLGVRIQPVTDDIAESLGLEASAGALISGIEKGGPAEGGELKPGDVIVSFNGEDIADVRELSRVVADSPVGEEVDVEIVRDGERQSARIVLGRLEESEATAVFDTGTQEPGEEPTPLTSASVLGMGIREIDDEARSEFGLAEGISGVVVTEVEEGSSAAEQNIQAGDVIAEVDQQSVSGPQEVLDRVEDLKDQGRRNAYLLMVSPTGDSRFVNVRIR